MPLCKESKATNSPAPFLGQDDVKLTSRSADEHSTTLPVTATTRTVATEHLLWTTYSLSNSMAVSKAMICYWSFLYVLHNALEIAQRRGKAFEPSWRKIPWLPEKGYFADRVKLFLLLCKPPASHPLGEGLTLKSLTLMHVSREILFEILLVIEWHW